tara:strand:+ start:918 stop:1493 length:576 start_codon:yes stop_codon:yes gene_type:complete
MSNLLILTGPSGVGKDSLVDSLIDTDYPIFRPPTMTTRAPRPGEIEGVHHFFVTPDEFQAHVDNQDLLENAYVYGNRYGVPRQSVDAALQEGNDVVIRVDVQGALSLLKIFKEACFVSLETESLDILRDRLRGRATESIEVIETRIAVAEEEIRMAREFCHVLVNHEDDLERTVRELVQLLQQHSDDLKSN